MASAHTPKNSHKKPETPNTNAHTQAKPNSITQKAGDLLERTGIKMKKVGAELAGKKADPMNNKKRASH